MTRTCGTSILRKAGFHVTTAANGDDALALLADGRSFDALVTDHAMPGLSGLALTELALERVPDLPVMVVTGYGQESELQTLPARIPVLAKPMKRNDFVHWVQVLVGGDETTTRVGAQTASPT